MNTVIPSRETPAGTMLDPKDPHAGTEPLFGFNHVTDRAHELLSDLGMYDLSPEEKITILKKDLKIGATFNRGFMRSLDELPPISSETPYASQMTATDLTQISSVLSATRKSFGDFRMISLELTDGPSLSKTVEDRVLSDLTFRKNTYSLGIERVTSTTALLDDVKFLTESITDSHARDALETLINRLNKCGEKIIGDLPKRVTLHANDGTQLSENSIFHQVTPDTLVYIFGGEEIFTYGPHATEKKLSAHKAIMNDHHEKIDRIESELYQTIIAGNGEEFQRLQHLLRQSSFDYINNYYKPFYLGRNALAPNLYQGIPDNITLYSSDARMSSAAPPPSGTPYGVITIEY